MQKYCLVLLSILALVLALATSPVSAQSTRRYYDWSSTLQTQQQPVLGVVFAQEATGSATTQSAPPPPETYKQFSSYFLGGNLTPTSPFYFIKPLQESIQLTFTFDPKKKAELTIAIAGERLSEVAQMTISTNPALVTTTAINYQKAMDQAISQTQATASQATDPILSSFEQETAKHNVILEKVAARVSDQAKPAINKALEASWKGIDTVADLSGRPAVPPDVATRLQALKAQGLLTEEETNKLIGSKTRLEARGELKKYVSEGIVPEADFIRLNENVRVLYPQEFFKIHELKRFYELKRLESEKPDDTTLVKIQEFSKTYKPGELVPAEIRRYWVPVVRLEEIQNTFRPDLIDEDLIRPRQDDYKKFTEIIERLKPRPEEVAFIKTYITRNRADVNNLPPEYQRMYHLSQTYGAQCGAGMKWVGNKSPGSPGTVAVLGDMIGYCIPEGSTTTIDLSRTEDFARGKSCTGSQTAAKGFGGACSSFPSDCIPPGWTRIATCVETPSISRGDGIIPKPVLACGTNTHFVPVYYMSEGGYCAPNYTSTDQGADTACQAGYHRNYSSGPCLPNYQPTITGGLTITTSLPPIGQPIYYPPTQKCGPGTHWVPEPINPSGGYCAPDNYYLTPYTHIPYVCTLYCPDNQYLDSATCSCRKPGDTSYLTPYSGGAGSRESQEAACKSGGGTCSFSGDFCNCQGYKYPTPGTYQTPTTYYQTPYSYFTPSIYYQTPYTYYQTPTTYYQTPFTYPSPSGTCPNYTPGTCPTTGGGSYFDFASCSCKATSSYSYPTPYTYQSPYTYYQTPGYYSTPYSYTYPTPYTYYQSPGYYSTPYSYSYPTPYTYQTPYSYSYPTPYTYPTPYSYSYPTPYSYSYPTPYSYSYPTPYSYSYPTPYSYSYPSPYGTPEYSYPSPYGTPAVLGAATRRGFFQSLLDRVFGAP